MKENDIILLLHLSLIACIKMHAIVVVWLLRD